MQDANYTRTTLFENFSSPVCSKSGYKLYRKSNEILSSWEMQVAMYMGFLVNFKTITDSLDKVNLSSEN